jgi:hypothetical protein
VIKLSNGQTVERNRKHLIWDSGYDNYENSENEIIKKKRIEEQETNKRKKKIFKESQSKSGRMIKKPRYLEDYVD